MTETAAPQDVILTSTAAVQNAKRRRTSCEHPSVSASAITHFQSQVQPQLSVPVDNLVPSSLIDPDDPTITGSLELGFHYDFYWKRRSSSHQQQLLPGYPIYIFSSKLNALKLYAPSTKDPSYKKYAYNFALHLMGALSGVIRCYANCRPKSGILIFLGAQTIEALCGTILNKLY